MKVTYRKIDARTYQADLRCTAPLNADVSELPIARIVRGTWSLPAGETRWEINWLRHDLGAWAFKQEYRRNPKPGVEITITTYTDTLGEAKALIEEALIAKIVARNAPPEKPLDPRDAPEKIGGPL